MGHWINDCEWANTPFVGKKGCDQPAIRRVGEWKLCFEHTNVLAKAKLKKRKDGSFVNPRE